MGETPSKSTKTSTGTTLGTFPIKTHPIVSALNNSAGNQILDTTSEQNTNSKVSVDSKPINRRQV